MPSHTSDDNSLENLRKEQAQSATSQPEVKTSQIDNNNNLLNNSTIQNAITNNLITEQQILALPESTSSLILSEQVQAFLEQKPSFVLLMLKLTKEQAESLTNPTDLLDNKNLCEFLKKNSEPLGVLELYGILGTDVAHAIHQAILNYPASKKALGTINSCIEARKKYPGEMSEIFDLTSITKLLDITLEQLVALPDYIRSCITSKGGQLLLQNEPDVINRMLKFSKSQATSLQSVAADTYVQVIQMIGNKLLPEAHGISLLIAAGKLTQEQFAKLNKDQANILADNAIAQRIIDDGKDLTEFSKARIEPLNPRELGRALGYTLKITGYPTIPNKPDSYKINGVFVGLATKVAETETKVVELEVKVDKQDPHPERTLLSEFKQLVTTEGANFTIEKMEAYYSKFKRTLLATHKPSVQYTRAYMNAVSEIRHIAYEQLKNKILANNAMTKNTQNNEPTLQDKNDMAETLLLKAKDMAIFNTHRSQYWFTGAWGNTDAINAIDIMLNNLEKARTQGRTLGQK